VLEEPGKQVGKGHGSYFISNMLCMLSIMYILQECASSYLHREFCC
jgi:hypothetical protein